MTERSLVLYIEDNPDNQRLVQRILEARGFTVRIAEDGPAGIAQARTSNPALILVDINIPGLDGYETTTRLRGFEHLRSTPIIALTADNRVGARERSLVAGCDGYLLKPIDPRLLPLQLEEFMGGKRETVPQAIETTVLREYNQALVERLERQVRDLSAANIELQEVDRLKTTFLATLSHELRTPLTSILGYLELFERRTLGPLNDVQNQSIAVIMRNTRQLSLILNNLLYLQEVRSSEIRRTPIIIHDTLRQLIAEMQSVARTAELELVATIAPTGAFSGDSFGLGQAFLALIDTAIK
ncbi:MAG TPA: hybrid sensor histidine kinase/response regulator, partial [Roseiflexaceae bacterium]|nr:hybrid sensor histidine kinase/response regulator [Roseiflexaceae bacterium]